MKTNPVTTALLGVAVGDALGVPFEFSSRAEMAANPATDMIGYGTHNQPPGTWSDDSSLTFCLAESLLHGYDLADMARRFINWKNYAYWTAREELFDIGLTTSQSIGELEALIGSNKLEKLASLRLDADEYDNGNGSLMRILPLLFFLKGKPLAEQWPRVWEVSALTHRHMRAAMACQIYLRVAEYLLEGLDKEDAYQQTRTDIQVLWQEIGFPSEEQEHFAKLIQGDIRTVKWENLKSGGYVMESIEASLWCLLQKESFESSLLSIINLGHDTDTSAAIVGGLAALLYGSEAIPEYWLFSLARMEDIMDLGDRLHQCFLNGFSSK